MEGQTIELATILHVIFCNKEHVEGMANLTEERREGYCYWYLEESIDNCWNMDDHKYWLMQARLFEMHCEEGGATPTEVTSKMADLIEICRFIVDLYEFNPNLQTYIVKLLQRL